MKKAHFLFLIPVLLALAFYSALGRVGWALPIPEIAAKHGFLMVSGLFATLISLERSLILKNKWWLSIPLFSTVSVVFVLWGREIPGFGLQLMAALLLTALYVKQWRQYREVYFLGLCLSGIAWGMSAIVLLSGNSFAGASMWYILFLLFTIVAERLELSKFIASPKWAKSLLVVLLLLLFAAQAIPFHWGANYLSGIVMASIGYWLINFDIVKINLGKSGFFFYTGSTLFGGYIWLMLSGVLMALPLSAPYHYDAVLHSFFIGFAFSMLYAHAPIIFPALLKLRVKPFHKILYLPVFATHLLLLLRLYADYSLNWPLRKWLGLLQVVVMLFFFISFAILMIQSAREIRKAI